MPDTNTNIGLLVKKHRTAARWERIRAAYFTRIGKPDNATLCKLLVQYHQNQAKEALLRDE